MVIHNTINIEIAILFWNGQLLFRCVNISTTDLFPHFCQIITHVHIIFFPCAAVAPAARPLWLKKCVMYFGLDFDFELIKVEKAKEERKKAKKRKKDKVISLQQTWGHDTINKLTEVNQCCFLLLKAWLLLFCAGLWRRGGGGGEGGGRGRLRLWQGDQEEKEEAKAVPVPVPATAVIQQGQGQSRKREQGK